ncbi:MAG: thioredoxin family protein [Pseudomonadota bacterium]
MNRALIALLLLPLAASPAQAEMALLMLDQPGCEWCEQWEAEIGGAYHLTEEGARAPLQRADIHDPLPEGVTLERRVHFTPTFVLLQDGREVGRLDGYAGEDFFYPMLNRLLDEVPAEDDTQ